jgi:type IV pilus assembly protein PilB
VKLAGDKEKYVLEVLNSMNDKKTLKRIRSSKPSFIFEAQGCEKCNYKGYSGRIGVFEIMTMTPKLRDIISKSPSEKEILKEAKNQGMISMLEDGVLKVLSGITTIEEVTRVTAD